VDARKLSGEWILPDFLAVNVLLPDMFFVKKVKF
jgi:hypothetical protein